jgi:AcrR family transcriptional regulator
MAVSVEEAARGRPVAQTPRAWLIEALFQLLRSRPYDALTVAELAERAGVARRTFYRLFPTKDALLAAALEELCATYARRLRGAREFSMPTLARAFLGFWFDELATLRALDRSRLLPLLLEAMNASLPKVPGVARDWGRVYGTVEVGLDLLALSFGGLWEIVLLRMREGTGLGPEDLGRLFAREMALIAASAEHGAPVRRPGVIAVAERTEADRPRARLVEALFLALRSRRYEDLTVAAIAARAGVSRRTFYRLFPSRDALRAAALQALCAAYERRLLAAGDRSFPAVVQAFLEFWFDNLARIRALDRSAFLPLLREAMGAYIPGIRELADGWAPVHGSAEETRDAVVFCFGGSWNLLVRWMRKRKTRGPEDVHRVLGRAVAVMTDPGRTCRWGD